MCTKDHGDGVPEPDFDRSLQSPLERAAAMARLRADGPERLAHHHAILKELVSGLTQIGFTRVQIYDDVMGRLWGSTTLIKRGRDVRNDTILLTRAMLIQIISERG
jgi:hypothetical protein